MIDNSIFIPCLSGGGGESLEDEALASLGNHIRFFKNGVDQGPAYQKIPGGEQPLKEIIRGQKASVVLTSFIFFFPTLHLVFCSGTLIQGHGNENNVCYCARLVCARHVAKLIER